MNDSTQSAPSFLESPLRAYLAILAMRCKVLLQYRAAAFAGFVTQLFWGFIKVMVFVAFYAAVREPQPLDFSQVLVYIWLGQGLLGLLPWNIDREIASQIRTGNVAYELLRPLGLYRYWFVRTFAFRLVPTLLRVVPMLAFTWFALPLLGMGEWALPAPAGWMNAVLFFFAVVGALFLSTAFTMMLHIGLIWTISGEGINRIMPGIVPLLAGLVVPLPLFPDWLQPILYWQPFRSMADVPFRIYSGHIGVADVLPELMLQWVWFALIVAAGLALLNRGARRLVVQGG